MGSFFIIGSVLQSLSMSKGATLHPSTTKIIVVNSHSQSFLNLSFPMKQLYAENFLQTQT